MVVDGGAHYTADTGLGVVPVGRGEDFTPIAARSDSFELPAGGKTWHVLHPPPILSQSSSASSDGDPNSSFYSRVLPANIFSLTSL